MMNNNDTIVEKAYYYYYYYDFCCVLVTNNYIAQNIEEICTKFLFFPLLFVIYICSCILSELKAA